MNVSSLGSAKFLASSLLLLALFSFTSPLGRGQVSPTGPFQQDSLALTVNPDTSVGVGWNTTSTIPAVAIPQNVSTLFPSGYKVHSSSSFSQKSSSVVQTTTVQYQLPTPSVNIVNSISLTASQTGLTGQGSLAVITNVPTGTTTITYSTIPTQILVNASSHFSFVKGLIFLSNRTAFETEWGRTFGNNTWTRMISSGIQNATSHFVMVTSFYGRATYSSDNMSATVSIGFAAVPSVPSQPSADFVTVLESILTSTGGMLPGGLDSIIRSTLDLETGESLSLNYSSSTYTLIVQSTTTYVVDLDAQVNKLKNQFFQLILSQPGAVVPASVVFLNNTSVTISQMSMTSDFDLGAGTFQMSLRGLLFKPPTVGSSTDFTIPGLFQIIGRIPSPGVNFTLVGGSDSTYQVKIVVPASTPQPSSTTSNSATWTNLQDASTLSAVQFQLQHLQGGLLAFLVSPLGIAIEAIVAIAVVAAVVLYMAKRRAAKASLAGASGPTPVPGFGPPPAPAPATP